MEMSIKSLKSSLSFPFDLLYLPKLFTKGSPLGDTLSLSCEASVGTSGSNN